MRIFILVFFMAFNIQANPIVIQNIETVTRDNATLKGVRWANEGKPRILLVHGFSENTTVFQDLAVKLHEMGYDVFAFNFRGHGNEAQRSLVKGKNPNQETKIGTYSFDRVITQDIPAMIDYVYDGKPIVTLGHSLGGSALRFFLSGVRDYGKGATLESSKKLQEYTLKVQTLINLGSPTSFQISDLRFKAWKKLPTSLTNLALNPVMRKYLGQYIFSGLVNMDNIRDSERLFSEGFSIIPVDIIHDVRRWSDTIYSSRTGIQYEGLPLASGTNFFQVLGGTDNLVPLEEALREHKEYRITNNPKLIVMKNFGHVDLAYDQPSAKLLSSIVDTIVKKNNVENLKNKNIRVIELKVKILSCNHLF